MIMKKWNYRDSNLIFNIKENDYDIEYEYFLKVSESSTRMDQILFRGYKKSW